MLHEDAPINFIFDDDKCFLCLEWQPPKTNLIARDNEKLNAVCPELAMVTDDGVDDQLYEKLQARDEATYDEFCISQWSRLINNNRCWGVGIAAVNKSKAVKVWCFHCIEFLL